MASVLELQAMSVQQWISFGTCCWMMGFALNDAVLQDLGKPECGIERVRTAHRTVLVS